MKKLSQAIVLAGAMTAGLVGVQAAHAELSASVDIANTYIFRGVEMGVGTPAISGALDYSHSSGLYAGIWTTSGDTGAGSETNYYIGFAGEVGDFTYDINYLNYYYQQTRGTGDSIASINDLAEVTLGLGYGSVGVTLTAPVDYDGEDYIYATVSLSAGVYGVLIGHNEPEDSDSFTHLDFSYQFNDNVSFVVSQALDGGDDVKKSPIFQVNYSLPINL